MNINLRLYNIPTPYYSLDQRAISGATNDIDSEPFGYAIFVPREWVRVSGCYTKEHDENLVFDFIPRIANALVDNYYIMASFQGCPIDLPKVADNRVASHYGEWWEDYAYVACHLGRIDQLLSLMGLSPVSFSDFPLDEIEDAATRVGIDDHIVMAYRPMNNEVENRDYANNVYPVVWLDEKEDEVLLRLALG